MKAFRNPIFVVLILSTFITVMGCGTNTSGTGGSSASRITGTWQGNFQTTSSSSGNSNYSGSLTLYLTQSGTIVLGTADGSVSGILNGGSHSSSFSGTQVSGTMNNQDINANILFGAYQVNLQGTVTSNTTSMSGTWTGDFTQTGQDTCSGNWTVLKISSSTT